MNEKYIGSECETNALKCLEELAQRSRLTEADADRLADELKAEWWTANKDRFIPANER
jgi:hypothetical protein